MNKAEEKNVSAAKFQEKKESKRRSKAFTLHEATRMQVVGSLGVLLLQCMDTELQKARTCRRRPGSSDLGPAQLGLAQPPLEAECVVVQLASHRSLNGLCSWD